MLTEAAGGELSTDGSSSNAAPAEAVAAAAAAWEALQVKPCATLVFTFLLEPALVAPRHCRRFLLYNPWDTCIHQLSDTIDDWMLACRQAEPKGAGDSAGGDDAGGDDLQDHEATDNEQVN
jgi:hypothetical protein